MKATKCSIINQYSADSRIVDFAFSNAMMPREIAPDWPTGIRTESGWSDMKLSWKRIKAHTKHPFRIARPGSSVDADGRSIERILVSVEHDGIIGLGEAVPVAYYKQSADSVEAALGQAQSLLGDDPANIDAIVDRLLETLDDHRAAVSAIDLALHDWLGKREGQPVWKLLGLNPNDTPATSMTLGIDRLDLLAEKVAQAAAFSILKIKVGTEHDGETLTTLRELAPYKQIRVDANCGWPPHDLRRHFAEMLAYDVELIEQPTLPGHLDALRACRNACCVPIVADEDSVRPGDVPALAGAYDGINIKLTKCGGIREARRMIDLARKHGMNVMLGCMVETSVGIAGAAQIASLCDYVDLDGHLLLADDPFCGLAFEKGVVRPSDAPGLGVWARNDSNQ